VTARAIARDRASLGQDAPSIAVIDLDVHQGNGTAKILVDDEGVFTLSVHGEKNFPFRKEASDLDVGLPDGCDDDGYLEALDGALATMLSRFAPDFLFYLAGADPYRGDRLGRLDLTVEGLAARDRRVFDLAAALGTPIVVMMAGGYGHDIEETCAIHAQTVALGADHARRHALQGLPDARGEAA
jgi:acetoin utilization deacetylase AcuC-like enzyme